MTPADISAALAPYGAHLDESGRICRPGPLAVRLRAQRGRLRAESAATGALLFSGPANAAAVERFVEGFWYWTKAEAAPAVTNKQEIKTCK